MQLEIINELDYDISAQTKLLQSALCTAAQLHYVGADDEIVVTITNNSRIRELNLIYRGKDCATDVLSFAYDECDEPVIVGVQLPRVLGDVIISIDKVREQAEQYNHSEARELGYLAVHGFLHLLGFDHIDKADKVVMRAEEESIMHALELTR